jgi:hypothetical protein
MEYLVGIIIIIAVACGIGVLANRRPRAKSGYTGWVPIPREEGEPAPAPPPGGSAVQRLPAARYEHIHYQSPSTPAQAPTGGYYNPPPAVVQNDDDGLVTDLIIGQTIAAIADDLSQPDPTPVQGDGGSFGGAGSDASWTPDPTPAPEPDRYEAPSYDPPSYDSGSSSSDN